MVNKSSSGFPSIQAAILIGSLMISISILVSGGVIRPKSGSFGSLTDKASPKAEDVSDLEEDGGVVKVSLDDDPVMGDKNAKVTIVEFSDYECPFCKSYFDNTLPKIKKEYIDTGKVRVVFRDLPLSFHQNAHKEAQAANCAREQGGDEAYFRYHDMMFKTTTSNGTGLSIEQLPDLARQVGLNGDQLKVCLDSSKYKEEVDKDLADAEKYGASGTPTFFVGKSGDKEIEGEKMVGAQPYESFKTLLDKVLGE